MSRPYPKRRRRRPGRRPPYRDSGRHGPPHASGFTPADIHTFYKVLTPGLHGREKRQFFNQASAWMVLGFARGEAILCYSWLGPLGVLVALDAGGIHPLLGGRLRRVGVPPDVINQPVDQIIIQTPVAMVGEGQQVDPHEVLVELFQPEDRVLHGQRRMVRDALVGDLEMGQQLAGDVV
jgi:hypothetical protein